MNHAAPQATPWPFLLPLLAVLLVPSLFPHVERAAEPGDREAVAADQAPGNHWLVYSVAAQAIAGGILLVYFWPEYQRHFPFKISPVGILIGVIGVLLWVGICAMQIERGLLDVVGWGYLLPSRPGINPYAEFGQSGWFPVFLLFRFAVLAVVIPLAEELLVRGWLIRWVHDSDDWETVSLKQVGWYGFWALMAYAVLTHPQESLAAIVWFGLVHWMMKWTGRFWDCVLAHAVTNFLLGVYIMGTATWHLW